MRSLLVATSFACVALGALVTGAEASPLSLIVGPAVEHQSLAQPVDYRNYCGRWREECRERWGWRTWRFRRCLAIHGCA